MLIWNWMMLLLVSAIRAWNHIFPHGFMFSFHRLCNSIFYVGELGFTIWAPNLNIKHVSRFVLKNAETVEGSSNLSPVKIRRENKTKQIGSGWSTCCTCPRCGAWRHMQWREGTLPKLELGQPKIKIRILTNACCIVVSCVCCTLMPGLSSV